jgi:hypothetical protein
VRRCGGFDFGQVSRVQDEKLAERKGESSTGTVAEGREDGEEPSQGIATSIEVLLLQLQLKFEQPQHRKKYLLNQYIEAELFNIVRWEMTGMAGWSFGLNVTYPPTLVGIIGNNNRLPTFEA